MGKHAAPATAEDMQAQTDAFEQTVRSTIQVCAALNDAEWTLSTECPGWSVKDNVAHIVDIERHLLGDPAPAHTPPSGLPHVRNSLGQRNEAGVDLRRQQQPAQVVEELQEVLERRLAALRGGDIDPQAVTETPFGRSMPYADFMTFRAFDCWTHEQDIRRATDRPGNLDAPASDSALRVLTNGLPYVVGKPARGQPGQSVAFEVGEPVAFTAHIEVGEDGRAHHAKSGAPEATVTLSMSWETFVRLGCGRFGPDEATVQILGDRDMGQRVLASMAITP